jgi:hypothetical protein
MPDTRDSHQDTPFPLPYDLHNLVDFTEHLRNGQPHDAEFGRMLSDFRRGDMEFDNAFPYFVNAMAALLRGKNAGSVRTAARGRLRDSRCGGVPLSLHSEKLYGLSMFHVESGFYTGKLYDEEVERWKAAAKQTYRRL